MADYSRETMQALREIAQEMRGLRKALEGIDMRLATSGGLTNALTRRAHMIVDGDKNALICSACGSEYMPTGNVNLEEVRREFIGRRCKECEAIFSQEAEFA